MSAETDYIFRVIEPFGKDKRGAGLREAAAEVIDRHGKNASSQEVVQWCLHVMNPMFAKYEGLFSEVVPFYMALHEWGSFGFPHFTLTPDFFTAVALTDFGDPTDEPLYMPYNAFTMSFPQSDMFHNATKLMVYRLSRMITQDDQITNFSWKMYRATLLKDDPIFSQWDIGMTRKQLVDEKAALDASIPKAARPLDEDEKELPFRMRTLLANVMTYIESQGPLPTEARPKKGGTPAAVERTHKEHRHYDVGRVVRLDGALRKAMQESAGNKERWRVMQRFTVRGHWKSQPYGEGRSLRKRIHIAPYYKGPENAVEALTRSYEVK